MSEPADKPAGPSPGDTARLPRDIAPPVDLWPAIEACIERSGGTVEHWLRRLPEAIEPPRDLWAGVAPRLDAARSARLRRRGAGGWLTAFASAGMAATFAALVAVGVRYAHRPLPAGAMQSALPHSTAAGGSLPLLQALLIREGEGGLAAAGPAGAAARTLLRELELVRSQREAVQRALRTHSGDADLRAVWRHAYEAELDLTADAERVLTRYQPGYRR